MDTNPQQTSADKPSWYNRPIPPALRMYGGIWLAIIASLCVPLLNILPGVYVFCLYLLIIICAAGLLFERQSCSYWLIGIAFVIAIVCFPNFINIKDGVGWKASCTKQNTHSIQLALERYATDNNGLYPLNMEVLRYEAYMCEFPTNEYVARSQWARDEGIPQDSEWLRMHPLGEELFEEGYPLIIEGNFVYIPYVQYDTNGAAYAKDYLLMSFARGTIRPNNTSPKEVVYTPAVLLTSKSTEPVYYITPHQ